jgi:hypothetical protein
MTILMSLVRVDLDKLRTVSDNRPTYEEKRFMGSE